MLTILLGTDWTANRDAILNMIAQDVALEKGGRVLMVPELISHDTERRLCEKAGDTSSRFAEVLSFTRLARRVADAAGHGAKECLDNGGRLVAMASAARQLHSRLKAYASVETRPEFLSGLVDIVDEFKRCCITPSDLMRASKETEGSFAQKLEELSLLLECYDALCQQGKRDPRDQMSWLLEQLEDGEFAQNHVFYIDGFPDFTRQHTAILEHLICNAQDVVIGFHADKADSYDPAFEKAGDTAGQLLRFAKRAGVPVKTVNIAPSQCALQSVRDKLFQGKTAYDPKLDGHLRVYRAESVYDECLAAAHQVMQYVRDGARYRDISIVCGDMAAYKDALRMVFGRCNIPFYQAGTEEILDKSVIATVLAALEAALGGFEQQDVLRYLRSMLSPLDLQTCDRVENYAVLWNINGSRWLQEWTNHPAGLSNLWSEADKQQLAELNAAREVAITPLMQLHKGFRDATNLQQQVQALYTFLDDIQLAQRLSQLAQENDDAGDNRSAQILNQLWDIMLSALEQLYDVLGDTVWDSDTFTRLLKLLLSQYDVGTIPPVLDAVMAGPVSAMRCQQTKHLIVLGALEGSMPSYGGAAGVLSDQERTALRQLGVPLMGGAMDGLQAEFSEIYGVFCGAMETISVSCPAGQPSFIYRRLLDLSGGEKPVEVRLVTAMADPVEAAAYLARYGDHTSALKLGIDEQFSKIEKAKNHQLGQMAPDTVRELYGDTLRLSASQIDRQAECRLSYFLKYGLRAQELKSVSVDPAEFGTYVHAVLELTAREIMERGGFKTVSLDDTLQIARRHAQDYAQQRFQDIDSERLVYLFRRNAQELELVVQELWQELSQSDFVPVGFEVSFGDQGQMGAIPLQGKTMQAMLRGFVDRVDKWQLDERSYFRVVDYKTGRKDFDYCDVFNGIGLQMLLYLFALEDEGKELLGENLIPAGVQYFPARVPLISADGRLTEEDAQTARDKNWKRKGLLLGEENVLSAMEPDEVPKRSYTRKRDGSVVGDFADRKQFRMLKAYVFMLLGKMVDDIASGCVAPNPYTRGSSHSACAFCPYGAVCHQASVEGRRDYRAMPADRFWNEIEKELSNNG